jgi:hypothetical protein
MVNNIALAFPRITECPTAMRQEDLNTAGMWQCHAGAGTSLDFAQAGVGLLEAAMIRHATTTAAVPGFRTKKSRARQRERE